MKDINSIINNKELDLSKWDTNNVKDMSYLFYSCESLKALPNISKWNLNNVKDISGLFYDCKSLKTLPDISYWNIKNVKDMSYLFYSCKSLLYLPKFLIGFWKHRNKMDFLGILKINPHCMEIIKI